MPPWEVQPFAELPEAALWYSFSWKRGPTDPLAITVTPNDDVPADATVEFDYGDDTGATAETTHTYNAEGSFVVTMTVTLADGRYTLATTHVTVKALWADEFDRLIVGVSNEWLRNIPADQLTPAVAPTVATVTPNTAELGSAPVAVSVEGTGFYGASQVVVGGVSAATAYVSPTELSAVVDTTTAVAGLVPLVVVNPDSGLESDAVDFTFTEPPPPVIPAR